jgi:hypothetical protein
MRFQTIKPEKLQNPERKKENGTKVSEVFCNDEGMYDHEVVDCEYGCYYGACLTCVIPDCDNMGVPASSIKELLKTDEVTLEGCTIYECIATLYSNVDCYDSDGSKDPYVKGYANPYGSEGSPGMNYDDGCNDIYKIGKGVNDYFCEDGALKVANIYCPNGCFEGTCIKENDDVEGNETEIEEGNETEVEEGNETEVEEGNETEVEEGNETEEKNIICEGCPLDNKCYPFGYRKGGKYCSDGNEFVNYKDKKESCDNNFECSSNLCIDSECVKEGLFRKIINWFRRVFGRD